jgi:hypothetical protein
MMDFVHLYYKRNRGWPSPDESWGLDPMFGEDGWCRSCGTPLRAQCGSLMLRPAGLVPLAGAWVPNWRFDAICLEGSLAAQLAERFKVNLREVVWKSSSPGAAMQIVVPSVGSAWYDPEVLRERTEARHGTPGATCSACGLWRWMPLPYGLLPPLVPVPDLKGVDIAASPEWFGAGCQSFRQILLRRELAELISAASPRDFKVQDVR